MAKKTDHAKLALMYARQASDAAKSAVKKGSFCTTSLRFLNDGYERLGRATESLAQAVTGIGIGRSRTVTAKHYEALDEAERALQEARSSFERGCDIDLRKEIK